MKILFIASRFPYPPIQGDRVRGYQQLRLLSCHHDIYLVTPQPESGGARNLEAIYSFCQQVEIISTPSWRRLQRLAQAPFTTVPLQTLYFFDPRFYDVVQSILQTGSFDLIHVQLVRMAPIAQNLKNIPRVIDLIDALSLNMRRRAQREHGLLAWLLSTEARRVQRYERALVQDYDQLVVSSPLDRQAIGEAPNLHIIPNGVDIKAYSFTRRNREPETILFSGRMGYFPNADAAIYFATKVLPLVQQRIPKARFLIVGADPPRRVRQLARLPGVVVTGYVPRIQDYLARATLAVAPMRAGSGMQFKVLEAMASGLPIVATPYALGGIEAAEGEHVLVAQDEEGLAELIVHVLQDSPLQEYLCHNARKLVEAKYSWEHSVRQLEEVYRRVIG